MDSVRPARTHLPDRRERRRSRPPGLIPLIAIAFFLGSITFFGTELGMRPEKTPTVSLPTAPDIVQQAVPEHNPDPAVIGPNVPEMPAIRLTLGTPDALVRYVPGTGVTEQIERGFGSTPILDTTGAHVAWVADSGQFVEVLHVERLDDPSPIIVYAGISPVWSAAWHDTRQGRIAEVGVDRLGAPTLLVASVVLDGFPKQMVADLSSLPGSSGLPWNIEAWGDWGFLLTQPADSTDAPGRVVILDPDGGLVSEASGLHVLGVAPGGFPVVRERSNGRVTMRDHALAVTDGPQLPEDAIRIAWLPNDGGFVVARPGEVQWHVGPADDRTLDLGGWPIGWSSDGTLVVMASPGRSRDVWVSPIDSSGRSVATFVSERHPTIARIQDLTKDAVALSE